MDAVQGAPDPVAAPVQGVGIDPSRAHVPVAEQILHRFGCPKHLPVGAYETCVR